MSFRFWPKLRLRVSCVSVRVVCVRECCKCVRTYVYVPLHSCTRCVAVRVCVGVPLGDRRTPPWRTLICCVVRIRHENVRACIARKRARAHALASYSSWVFLFGVCRKTEFFCSLSRWNVLLSFSTIFTTSMQTSLSANDRDVPSRHVSVCRLVRNLGQQWINPKLLVSKANLVKRR